MKAEEIVFLHYPCMVVVCESANTPNSTDPETNDLCQNRKGVLCERMLLRLSSRSCGGNKMD